MTRARNERPKRKTSRYEWGDREFYDPARSVLGVLKPDATLIGPRQPQNGERQVAVIIEFDPTGRPSKQQNRLCRYERFLLEGWRHSRFAACAGRPPCSSSSSPDAQARGTAHIADEELLAHWGSQYATRSPTPCPPGNRSASPPLPKLLNRDWDILQVAATDPKTRST